MIKTIKYLGSQAGDTFTYAVGDHYRAVFEKGKTVKVPEIYAAYLLADSSFVEVTAPATKTVKETE